MTDRQSEKPSRRGSRASADQLGRKRGLTLGFSAFEKISAVEGIDISPAMKRDIMAASADHLSPAERSRLILATYGKT